LTVLLSTVPDRLKDLYPGGGYVPASLVISGPGASAWSASCPQVHAARYPAEPEPGSLPCPEHGGSSIVVSKPWPWTGLRERMDAAAREHGWSTAERSRTGAAWQDQDRVMSTLADHVVVAADGVDPRAVADRVLGQWRYKGSVTVVGPGHAVLVALRVGGDPHEARYGYTIRLDPVGAKQPEPMPTALYAPALLAWHNWWHRKTRQQPMWLVRSLEALIAPWPGELEIADPHADQPHRIRITDIAPGRL
jgi:hypothetical protein